MQRKLEQKTYKKSRNINPIIIILIGLILLGILIGIIIQINSNTPYRMI